MPKRELQPQDSSVTFPSVGGYRLVRRLGHGSRAEVFLGHPESESRAGRPVAVKVFRSGADRLSIESEIAALEAAQQEHCVRLLDLATDPTGAPALILERLPLGSISRLLADRTQLGAGECVTILAPVALALDRLHAGGVTHGGVSSEAIGFREDGAPVLLSFGAAQLSAGRTTPASRAADPSVARDVSAFATVARAVLTRAEPELSPPVARLIEWLGQSAEQESFFAGFSDRVFDLAEAAPVSLGAAPRVSVPGGLPGRLVTAEPVSVEPIAEAPRTATIASLHLPPWLDEFLDSIPLAGLWDRLRGGLGTVRKPVWFAAGAVGIALIVAISVVPTDAGGTPAEAIPPSTDASFEPRETSAVGGGDPMVALPELLSARERCFTDLSVLCLDTVDQLGSPALAVDRALIKAVQDGGELPELAGAGGAELVERLGGSALISLGHPDDGQPASVLLMKGEAGWRIRAWLD